MNTPLVSVLTTAYNREKYITEAIESVLASTYKNFELIIVDDCSTDKTVEIARGYEQQDSRVRVYVNEKNLGDYPNRNKAASYAKGKYLKYVDADDLIYPHGLEILVESMEKFPQAGWGLCSLKQDEKKMFPFILSPQEAYRYNYFGPRLFHKAPLSSIIKKDVFQKINGFMPVRHYGDFEMWHRLAKYYPVLLLQSGVVWWRKHSAQEAKSRKNKPWIAIETVNAAKEHINSKDCPLNVDEKKIILRNMRNFCIGKILQQVKGGKFKMATRLYKISNL